MWRWNLSNRIIIGFCGAKGSGKDTGYKLLTELYPDLKFNLIAFADPIKNTICDIFGLTIDQLNTIKRIDSIGIIDYAYDKTYGQLTGRDLVRKIGMLMRNYDDQQFNRYVQEAIRSNPQSNYVVTDVRFNNEIAAVKTIGGYIIRVDRDSCKYDNHVTETKVENPDFIIDNNKDLQHYKDQLKNIVDQLLRND